MFSSLLLCREWSQCPTVRKDWLFKENSVDALSVWCSNDIFTRVEHYDESEHNYSSNTVPKNIRVLLVYYFTNAGPVLTGDWFEEQVLGCWINNLLYKQ